MSGTLNSRVVFSARVMPKKASKADKAAEKAESKAAQREEKSRKGRRGRDSDDDDDATPVPAAAGTTVGACLRLRCACVFFR